MIIEIPDENVEEGICNLKNVIDILYKYEELTNDFVTCEYLTVNSIIEQLQNQIIKKFIK